MTDPIDLGFVDECEREALHAIGAIQPCGALLGGRNGDPTLSCASANLADWSGLDPAAVLGRPLSALTPWLSSPRVDELTAAIVSPAVGADDRGGIAGGADLATAAPAPNPVPVGTRDREPKLLLTSLCSGPRGELDAVLSRGSRDWLLELQPALPAAQRTDAYRPVPHALYHMPRSADEWLQLCCYLADQMRAASGFERVMVYGFREDGSGEVIAESLIDGLSPYLGLRYPASDIPQNARLLYRANRHRQIPDAGAEPVALLSPDGALPDLRLSDLRAVSPVHVEYLRNMGVTASLSFPVVLNDELWGLIACHHRQPRMLPLPIRERCAEMVQAFTLGIAGYRNHRRLEVLVRSDRDIRHLIEGIGDLRRGAKPGYQLQQALLRLVGASGAALTENDADGGGPEDILTFGETPTPAQIREQLAWLRETTMEHVFTTDRLPSLYPPAADCAALASGLLAVRTGHFAGGMRRERTFLWWRPEQPQTVRWAGDPRKSAIFDAQSRTLSPRSSFDAWIETSRGRSEPWSDLDLMNAKKFRGLVLRDINADLIND